MAFSDYYSTNVALHQIKKLILQGSISAILLFTAGSVDAQSIQPDANNILYVDQNAEGGDGSGNSWNNAIPELRDALNWAGENWDGDTDGTLQIWVAGGLYLPADNETDRNATFQLINNVEIYGGFAGGEGSLDDRSWTENLTILSGDIDGNDSTSDGVVRDKDEIQGSNSYHVVTGIGINSTAIIDGFTITGGLANSSGGGMFINEGSPKVSKVIFSGNSSTGSGGGMYIYKGSPILTNVYFFGNHTDIYGGGIYTERNPITLRNVIFYGNSAEFGGGMWNEDENSTLINVTFYGNRALSGGGMYNQNASPVLRNVIMWGNIANGSTTTASASISTSGGRFSAYHSLIANSGGSENWDDFFRYIGIDGGNNLDADPLFANASDPDGPDNIFGTKDDGLRLLSNSPAINAGDPSTDLTHFPGGPDHPTDFAGNPRVYEGEADIIDMGAYEFQGELFYITPDGDNVLYVDQNVDDGDGSGDSWSNAIPELRDALAWAEDKWDGDADGTLQIWVADGLYLPTDEDSDPLATFQLINNVEIYGGFAGGENNLTARDWNENTAILSGDIGEDDLEFDSTKDSDSNTETPSQSDHIQGTNSLHVVTGSGTDNTAVLDGFTITAGYASEGYDSHDHGGGMYNNNGSPGLANLTITGNRAISAGGGIFNTENSSPVLNNIILVQNDAFFGGGMYNINSSPILMNVSLVGNSASVESGGIGNGGNSNSVLINTLFAENSAPVGGALSNGSNITLINTTFIGNRAETGGAVFNSSEMTVANSIFWGNSAENEANEFYNSEDGTVDITNSTLNVGDSDDVDNEGTLVCNSCSDLDPLFSDPDNSNFTLASNSPAINAGTNAPYEFGGDAEGITTDIAGNDRIYAGGTVDMGAYEFQGEPDEIPQGEDKRLLVGNHEPYIFTGDDFSLVGTVEMVRIIGFTGFGSLKLDGAEVSAFDDIPAEDISNDLLTFTSSESMAYGYDYAELEFQLIDDVGRNSESATLDIDVAATSVDLAIESEGWRFMASPVDGETVGDFFEPIWTQGFPGSDSPGVDFANIQRLNQEEYVWEPVESNDTELDAGDAVIVYVYTDDENNGTDDGFPKTLTSSTDNWLTLDGSYEESFFYDPDQQETDDSYYLWGNPHPVAIDLCEAELNNIPKNAYFWDPAANDGNGDYVNLSCDAIDDVVIAPYHSVWLRLTDAANSMELPAGTYLEGTTNGYFKDVERSEKSPKDLADLPNEKPTDSFLITLKVSSEDQQKPSFTNTTRILFDDEASAGSDLIDAPKLNSAGLAQYYLSLYSLDEESNPYALQALPTTMDEKTHIPLDVKTTESGKFTMDWSLPESYVFNGSYYLKDNQVGEVIELRDGASYSFEIEEAIQSKETKTTHPMSDLADNLNAQSNTHQMSSEATSRFELLIAASGVDGLTELGAVPDDFTLAQNYPNPFNPTTVISYQLPVSSEVRLTVYDMLGRQVATLVDGQVAAGRHTVNFDAGNLSSGVYLYRLQAGSQIMTRKLTILK